MLPGACSWSAGGVESRNPWQACTSLTAANQSNCPLWERMPLPLFPKRRFLYKPFRLPMGMLGGNLGCMTRPNLVRQNLPCARATLILLMILLHVCLPVVCVRSPLVSVLLVSDSPGR